MKGRWLLPPLTAALGFAVGYLSVGSSRHGLKNEVTELDSRGALRTIQTTHREKKPSTEAEISGRLRQISAYPSRAHRSSGFTQYLAGLSLDELRVVAEAMSEPGFPSGDARDALALRLLAIDPAIAARYALGIGAQAFLARVWAERDPLAALEWVKSWPNDRNQKSSALRSIFEELVERDLSTAVRILTADEKSWDPDCAKTVFLAWSKLDAPAATAAALQISNTSLRRAALDSAVNDWASKAPEAATAWFHSINDPHLQQEIAPGLARAIARTDLDSAVNIARSLNPGRAQETVIASLADDLVQHQRIDDAINLAGSIPFDTKNEAWLGFLVRARSIRPDAAMDALLLRANSPDIDDQEREAIKSWFPFVDRFVDPRTLMQRMAEGTGEAIDELRESIIPGRLAAWSSVDPAAARSWAEALPPGNERESAFQSIVRGWTSASADEVAGWIEKLSESPDRNAAITGFAQSNLPRDPDRALALLRSIPDAEQRAEALHLAWGALLKNDPKKAEQWSASKLTAAEQAQLAQGARKRD